MASCRQMYFLRISCFTFTLPADAYFPLSLWGFSFRSVSAETWKSGACREGIAIRSTDMRAPIKDESTSLPFRVVAVELEQRMRPERNG